MEEIEVIKTPRQYQLYYGGYTYKYIEEYSAGIKWNDEVLNIDWPNVPKYVISEKDDKLPAFREYFRK